MSFELTQRNLRTLNPEVFIKAAELINDRSHTLSCFAVEYAAAWCGCGFEESLRYADAYTAAFGPVTDTKVDRHPFWNKGYTRQRKDYRVNALLTMAAMVKDAKAKKKR